MQDHLNLLYREEEREMLPLCRDAGVGVVPWSPLARGRLSRPVGDSSARAAQDGYTPQLYKTAEAADAAIIAKVTDIAAARGVKPAQVAMAWVLAQPGVTAPVMGATKLTHLDDAAAAVDLRLTAEEIAALEAPYRARPVIGFA